MTNSEITYTVLSYCQHRSPVTIYDLLGEFPHIAFDLLEEVVYEMANAGLLRTTATRSLLMDGAVYAIEPIRGLTFLGEQWLDQFSIVEDDPLLVH